MCDVYEIHHVSHWVLFLLPSLEGEDFRHHLFIVCLLNLLVSPHGRNGDPTRQPQLEAAPELSLKDSQGLREGPESAVSGTPFTMCHCAFLLTAAAGC